MHAGALSSFVPDASERQRMMEAVGEACEQQGQLETARELYLAAPNPCAALRIMNRQLSDLTKPAITDEGAGMLPPHCACNTMYAVCVQTLEAMSLEVTLRA